MPIPRTDEPAGFRPAPVLEARDLVLVSRETGAVLVDGVSLTLHAGEILALVGESGSGKSLTAMALLGLLPAGVERRGGRVLLEGRELAGGAGATVRRRTMAAIFQDPQASLDPRWSVGRYLTDRFARLQSMAVPAARRAAIDMLARVGLANPARIMRSYPHELSGGMAQRVMIAGALAGEPPHPDRRRAHHGARRHHPGANPRSDRGCPTLHRSRRADDHARSGRRRRDRSSHHGALWWPRHGDGRRHAGAVRAEPSLHAGAARLHARPRERRASSADRRRATGRVRAGLSLRAALHPREQRLCARYAAHDGPARGGAHSCNAAPAVPEHGALRHAAG